MANKLINFALAKSIYSEKRNYLETFSPFILKVLHEKNSRLALSEVDDILRLEYDLKIPINTLKSILSILYNSNLINLDKTNKNYSSMILPRGIEYSNSSIDSERNIRRKLQSFWTEFVNFANKRYGANYEANLDEKQVFEFFNANIIQLIEYAFGKSLEGVIRNDNSTFEKHFSHFICEIERERVDIYDIFQEILKGYILWNEIANKENVEKETDFNNLAIYLDTNYLISLLGLDSPFAVKSAKQLYELLRRSPKIILKVLTITLDEIKRLLQDYKIRKNNYFDIPVNDVYYFLHTNLYDDAKIDLFVSSLIVKCGELGITVEEVQILEPSKLGNGDKKIYEELYKNSMDINAKELKNHKKEETIHLSTIHDVTAISYIKKKRGVWPQNLENSKAIFLTSSTRLDGIIKDKISNNSFPETILDLTLTNILWLKNPANDVGCSVQQIISIHSKNLFINHGVWKRFINTVQELQEEERINNNEYAYLISNNQTTKEFLKKSKPADVTPQSVLELLDKIYTEDALEKQELKEKGRQIMQQAEEISQTKKAISSLQSRLDKTSNQLQKERKEKEDLKLKSDQLSDQVQNISIEREKAKRNLLLKQYVENKLNEFKKEALIILNYFCGAILLYLIALLFTEKTISIVISSIIVFIAGVFVNKASNKKYIKTFIRVFRKKHFIELLNKEWNELNP